MKTDKLIKQTEDSEPDNQPTGVFADLNVHELHEISGECKLAPPTFNSLSNFYAADGCNMFLTEMLPEEVVLEHLMAMHTTPPDCLLEMPSVTHWIEGDPTLPDYDDLWTDALGLTLPNKLHKGTDTYVSPLRRPTDSSNVCDAEQHDVLGRNLNVTMTPLSLQGPADNDVLSDMVLCGICTTVVVELETFSRQHGNHWSNGDMLDGIRAKLAAIGAYDVNSCTFTSTLIPTGTVTRSTKIHDSYNVIELIFTTSSVNIASVY